jgi:hypothetical protein
MTTRRLHAPEATDSPPTGHGLGVDAKHLRDLNRSKEPICVLRQGSACTIRWEAHLRNRQAHVLHFPNHTRPPYSGQRNPKVLRMTTAEALGLRG